MGERIWFRGERPETPLCMLAHMKKLMSCLLLEAYIGVEPPLQHYPLLSLIFYKKETNLRKVKGKIM
jgi:hypothetical protein